MKTLRDIREALEVGTDEIVAAYKKATPGEVKEEDMPASPDEAGMAMDQAKFIGYVADEIMEYIQGNNEFPEWMQNKLSALHEKAKGVHAVMAGKYNESVQEELVDEASKGIEAMKKAGNAKADAEAKERAKKDRAGKPRPSPSFKSIKRKQYGNMMGKLKEEDLQELDAQTQKKFSMGAKNMKAYAQKNGGVDKKDFMDVAKLLDQIARVNLLQAGQLLSRLNRLVDGMDTDVRERIYAELKKVGLVESVEESFKPHMMYDPETGKAYKADKEEDHLRMKKMGYTHEKPDMDEAKQKNWMVTVTKPINKLKKGMKVIVPARNTAEAMKKALKRMGENPAAIGSGHLDVQLDKSLGESVQIDEAKFTPKEIKMAIGIASDPRYKGGNMTGAAKAINKIKKGLSDYPQVAAVLKRQNESVDLEEKLQVSDGMAKWIEDFQKSDAPQFVEKDKNERREMAIAAYLAAKRKNKDIEEAKKTKKVSGKKLTPDQIRKALGSVKAKGKETVSLKKAPWDK